MERNEKKEKSKLSASEQAATTFSNVSSSGNMYNHNRYTANDMGHGFAAEDMNHLHDLFHGKKATLVGADNSKHGADRLVDGVEIQTKFCNTGIECIQNCFQNNEFKYYSKNGQPMKIEVPLDTYDAAVQAMENRIRNGQVRGVTDPAQAKEIIKQSPFTRQQAINVTKAGNIDSLKFDMASGVFIGASTFGISATLSFALSVWNGEEYDIALRNSAISGIKIGGLSIVSSVVASQLSKAGLNSAMVSSSEAIVTMIGPKASAYLVNALRSGQNIYGAAAMKSAAKLLRSNVITGVITGALLSTGDVVNIFRGRISGGQLFKNVTNTAASIGGGMAGWAAGTTAAAAAGATIGSVIPVVGTIIGGAVGVAVGGIGGALLGGAAAGGISNVVTGAFIEDDAKEMVRILEEQFKLLAVDYLLNMNEVEALMDSLEKKLTGGLLKDMFASEDKSKFALTFLTPFFEEQVSKREKVSIPEEEQMFKGMIMALEKLQDLSNEEGLELANTEY